MGFTFDDTDKKGVANQISAMHELIRRDPRNAERIFPFISGEDVLENPTHSGHRFVINFEQMSEAEARHWPELMAIVEAKVKPERLLQNREIRAKYWWRYGEAAPALYEAIQQLPRVMVNPLYAQHLCFAFLPSRGVFANKLNVFSIDSLRFFAALQSRCHEAWARTFSSTLEDRLAYAPSDCFETFPFPERWESNGELERIGREYYDFRAGLMVRNNEGLTKTYNRFHDPDERDPDIVKLRDLHAAVDRAVLDAYGWTDIQPTCEFILDYEDDEDETDGQPSKKKKPWRYRWPDDIRDEVLGRLLELNAQRAKDEALAGAAPRAIEHGIPKKHRSKKNTDTPLLD